MAIVQRMREQLKDSMRAKDTDRTAFLRYWIAQLTRGDGTEVPDDDAIKKMRGIVKEAKAGPTTFSVREIELIGEWVPASLDAQAIAALLDPIADSIRSAPKDGMAMGLAMKHLAGQPVDSADVKAAVAAIRGG
jgi:uncharacterized protein YqeY